MSYKYLKTTLKTIKNMPFKTDNTDFLYLGMTMKKFCDRINYLTIFFKETVE